MYARRQRSCRPQPPRLCELALERAARVVGLAATPARRSSASQRRPVARARPRPRPGRRRSRGGRRLDALLLHRDQEPLDARAEADPRRRRPADLLDEVVVAAAARDRGVLVLGRADELEGRARVVVEAAHEGRDEHVGDAHRVQAGTDGREVLDACLAQRLADLRRLVERLPHRRRLGEVVVEHAERADVDLRPGLVVEPFAVRPRATRASDSR